VSNFCTFPPMERKYFRHMPTMNVRAQFYLKKNKAKEKYVVMLVKDSRMLNKTNIQLSMRFLVWLLKLT